MIQTEQVLENDSWEKMKPLGMSVKILSRETMIGGTTDKILLELIHYNGKKNTTIEVCIPTFTGNVIQWRNSKKALLFVGQILVDSDFEISMGTRDESERMDIHIICPAETARRKVEECITHALRNWFYGVEENYDINSVQITIDHWFANGTEWRVLKQSSIAQEDQQNGIIISSPIVSKSHVERMLNKMFNKKLWNIIDLNSTSFSDKANESFRFVEGVSVVDGKLVETQTNAPFCHIIAKHAVGLGMNPRRAYLARNTFEQVLDLVEPEAPIVSPYNDGETNMLHGLNLLTAIMHLDYHTHEDGIAISVSAAKKMQAGRIITQLVESDLPITLLVKVGDPVDSLSVIALDGEKEVLSNKLYMPGVVEEISVSEGKRFGKGTNRVWYKFRSFYTLENGDKLSNRHGGKGVVTIIPNEYMPWDPDTGKRVEVCIAPESVVNRRSMSVLWEMMLTKRAWFEAYRGTTKLKPIQVKLYEIIDDKAEWPKDELHDFKTLAQKWGSKSHLIHKGQPLKNHTFVGNLFWMRLDKIAKEIVSSVNKRRPKNSFGAVMDNAKISGQRCNVAKLLAMSGRGLITLSADTVEENISGKKFFQSLINAVHNEEFRKK